MMRAEHQAAFEQLMADLDGELAPAEAAAVRAHVAGCQDCQELEGELRGVRDRVAQWTVEEAPASLKSPVAAGRFARMRGWVPIAAVLVVALGVATIWAPTMRQAAEPSASEAMQEASASPPAESAPLAYPELVSEQKTVARLRESPTASPRYVGSQPEPEAGPLLARSARLTLLVSDLDAARAEVDRIVAAAGGFIGQLRLSDERGAKRLMSGNLRVPEKTLDATLDQLKRVGKVRREGRDAEDVTQQSADLNARLTNARNSEKRLNDILANRTGDLKDVLEAEREITRVRGEIEQMEAARRLLDRRITFANIELEMAEEQKAALDIGDESISAKLRNAMVGGWNAAFNSALDFTLLIAWATPTLLLWGLALIVPYRVIRRRFT